MPLSNATLTTAAAAAASALVVRHELKGRRTAERIAAASLESLLKAIDANDPATGAHVRPASTQISVPTPGQRTAPPGATVTTGDAIAAAPGPATTIRRRRPATCIRPMMPDLA